MTGIGLLLAWRIAAAPFVPGLVGDHGLTRAQVGRVLVEELRCGACHEGLPVAAMKSAPDLADVASRVRSTHIVRMIEDPAGTRTGSTMPRVATGSSAEQRHGVASSIAAFLQSLSRDRITEAPADAADAAKGGKIFHETGCVGCHSPRDEAGRETDPADCVRLNHVGEKYTRASLADFLLDPLKARPSGRMPGMRLTPGEARDVAAYLIGDAKPVSGPADVDANVIRAGRKHFQELNCAACHPLDGLPRSSRGPPRAGLDPARGCLSDANGRAPDFSLNDDQRTSIRAFLEREMGKADDAGEELAVTLVKFNCLACHRRDGHGGVTERRDIHFRGREEGLGNDGRIPPPLTLAGAKLRGEWMSQVLLEGRTVRPYMLTRMPQFGPATTHLPELFAKVDTIAATELAPPSRQENRAYRDAARQLLGDRGLNCVACHNFNGKDSPGFKGLDLMTSFQRLRPEWFAAYMKNPAAFRPGTIMPNYWPGGAAVQTEILGGDTDRQLRALWHYFSLGHSAADPSGIRSEPAALRVDAKARTYRGRNRTAGFRGIAVGLPGGWNYSFNAEYGTLVAIWRGDFINVNWRGQGAGDFHPAGRETIVTRDTSLVRLVNTSAPWPLHPVMTKEAPVNPDPLYPRNHGYAFRGYSLDANDVPAFTYSVRDIEVHDTTVIAERGGGAVLRRTLTFAAPGPDTLHFRALVGHIEALSDSEYRVGKLRLSVKGGESTLRPSSGNPDERELLTRLDLKPGETELELDYLLDE